MGVVRVLRIVWAAPNSLIGVLLALFFRRRRFTRGVLLAEGAEWPPRIGWRYSAITFGHVVLSVNDPISERVMEHELVHVRQSEAWGPLFLPAYVLASIFVTVRGNHPYRDNPFEVHARAEEVRTFQA